MANPSDILRQGETSTMSISLEGKGTLSRLVLYLYSVCVYVCVCVCKLMRRRLEWLGHLARMPDQRLPKMCIFSWLPQTRPQGGPRRRWRDLVKTDLKAVGVSNGCWYSKALDRKHWREVWGQRLE